MRSTYFFLLALVLQQAAVNADECVTTCGCCLLVRRAKLCGLVPPDCPKCPTDSETGRFANISHIVLPNVFGKFAFLLFISTLLNSDVHM